MKTGLSGSFSRLSSRERNLVYGLFALIGFLVIGGGVWIVRGKLAEKEDRIAKNRQTWQQIQSAADEYVSERARAETMLERIKTNPFATAPDQPIAQEAVQTSVRYRAGVAGEDETAKLNTLMPVKGDLRARSLTRNRRGQVGPEIILVEKDFQMTRGYARSDDIFKFLEEVEDMDNLVFVSKLHLLRRTQEPDYVQVKNLTAATLRFVEEEAEE